MKFLIIPAIAALIAIMPLAIEGYTTVRVVIFLFSAYGVFIANKNHLGAHFVVLVLIALIYNPIFPLWLGRDLWIIVDLLSASYFLWIAFQPRVLINDGGIKTGKSIIDKAKEVDRKIESSVGDKGAMSLLKYSIALCAIFFLTAIFFKK